jgi:Ca2+:H+ antiporter
MSPSEHSPLLNGDLQRRQSRSFYQKLIALLKAEGEPSWLDSFRWFIFGSWPNLLLLLVPVAAASHFLDWDAPLRFGFCFVAIVPLAKVRTTPSPHSSYLKRIFSQLLGDATEQMSLSLGQTLAGLLNATFGNAVEIIVGIVALFKGEVRIVQTSVCIRREILFIRLFTWLQMLGSILSNILLVLGCSFFAGMLKFSVP